MEVKFCPNCGAKLKEGAKFCGECGVAIAAAASNITSAVTTELTPNTANNSYEEPNIVNNYNTYQTYQTVSEGKRVSKLTYILLGIFLGGVGGHKFYSGQIGKGFLYLIFCWTYIPGIIALIEVIYAAVKKNADVDGKIIV